MGKFKPKESLNASVVLTACLKPCEHHSPSEEKKQDGRVRAVRSAVLQEHRRFRTQQILIVPDIFHVVSGEGVPEEGVGCCQSKWKWPGWAGPSDTLYRRRGIFNLGLSSTRYRHTHAQCALAKNRSRAKSLRLLKYQRLRASVITGVETLPQDLNARIGQAIGFQIMDSSCCNTWTWNFSQRILQCHSEKNPRT